MEEVEQRVEGVFSTVQPLSYSCFPLWGMYAPKHYMWQVGSNLYLWLVNINSFLTSFVSLPETEWIKLCLNFVLLSEGIVSALCVFLYVTHLFILELQWPCLLLKNLGFLLGLHTCKLYKLKWWEEATALCCCFNPFTDWFVFYLVTAVTGARKLSEC